MSEVNQLEACLEDAKALIAKRDLALKLYSNPEFKQLILEEFCVRDCARFAQNSGNVALTAEQRADSLAMAQSAGYLRQYLSQTVQMGNASAAKIDELEEEIEIARREEEAGNI